MSLCLWRPFDSGERQSWRSVKDQRLLRECQNRIDDSYRTPDRNGGKLNLRTAVGLDTRIPFELANKKIFIQVTVAEKCLWFLLDTGNKYALIDHTIAKSLGLELGDEVNVGGGGRDTIKARRLKNSTFAV